MQQLDLKPEYDVIIIGAGVAGLTSAALLAKAGLSVCVLEMASNAGGYLAGFRRKDFRFDTAIHWLNQCMPGGLVFRLFDVIGDDYPAAIPQRRIRRYRGDGFNYLLTNNPDELKEQWIAEFPHEQQGIERFFKAAKRIGEAFKNYGHRFRSEETMSFMERLRNKKNLLRFVLPFIPHIRYSGEQGLRKGLDKYFKEERLHKVFCSDTELLSCLIPIGWAYFGDYQSPPKGGSQRFPEWLTHVLGYYGHTVRYKCRVKQILVENGTAEGVLFEHRGKEYTVRGKYIIAACDVETLYEKMLSPEVIPQKLKSKLRGAELYSSSVTLSIALDCPAEELGFNEEMIHMASEGIPQHEYLSGDPYKSELSILAPTFRDKSLAPKGQGTLTIYMPALMDYESYWKTETDKDGNPVRGEAYQALKHRIADVLISRVEAKLAPGLREHILFCEVATPVTHWRYTGNKGGTMMGAKPGRANMQNKVAHYQTPVKHLLLGGHWAELGGGVPIAVKAAANAALLVFKEERPEVFRMMADYMDGKISLEAIRNSPLLMPYDNSWVPVLTPAEKKSGGSSLPGNPGPS